MQKKLGKSILITILIVFYSSLFAEEKKKNYKLESNVHAELIGIHEQIEEGQNVKALKKLKKLISSNNLKAYDSAVVYQTIGFAKSNICASPVVLVSVANHLDRYSKPSLDLSICINNCAAE